MWELVKHSEKDINTEGGVSDWGKLCARREAQCRPTLEQDCNQSKTTNCVKPFVNCSKNSVSTHEHLGYKSVTLWRLCCIFIFLQGWWKCIQKQNFLHIFLCTVNIQSIDRGIYIQFGTHGSDQQKDFITLKGVQVGRSPHKRVWALNFKPLDNKTNKRKYKGKLK